MQNDLVTQGLELMVFGMGTVVVFLALLVVTTGLMSHLVNRFFPEPELFVVDTVEPSVEGEIPEDTLVAVITAAITQHRRSRR